MQNLIFISIPEMDVSIPPAAAAALSPVAARAKYDMHVLDFNLELHQFVSSEEWQEIINFCELASDNIDKNLQNKIEELLVILLSRIIDNNTRFLALSIFSIYSIRLAKILLPLLRVKYPNLKMICGGNGLSSRIDGDDEDFGKIILNGNLSDYVIYGEGENALLSLLNGDADHPGINKPNQEQIDKLDDLPFADYSSIDLTRYTGGKLLITGSRGCVRDCTFCDIGKVWGKFKYRSAELLVDEIKHNFYETGITKFEFTDSLINGSTRNFRQFNELLYDAKQKDPALKPITYTGQFICKQQSNMIPEVYELMHLAGCSQITVGIESFSEHIRYHMRKKFSNADIEYHLDQCARWGIQNIWLMIVGYPTETEEDHKYALSCLKKYQQYALMDVIGYIRWGLTMHIYDDTPISKLLDELGIDEGIQNIRDGLYNWDSTKNPSLNLGERIRRRLELHEVSYSLGYKMPNVTSELLSIKALAEGKS